MLSTVLKPIREYTSFVLDKANRDIKPASVENLSEDIERMNMLDLYPIVANSERVIMDGQIRFTAARGMMEPCWVITGDDVTIEDMAEANANTIPYSDAEALAVYTKIGFPAYQYADVFLAGNPQINLGDVRFLLDGYTTRSAFIEGSFSVSRPHYAEVVAEYIKDFVSVRKWVKTSKAYKHALANLAFNPNYDHKRMMGRLNRIPIRLERCGTSPEALKILNGIYNYNIAEDKRVELKLLSAAKLVNRYDNGVGVIDSFSDLPVRKIAPGRNVEIYCTDDLSQFTVHPSARPVSERQLQRMIDFMKRRNLLLYYPILVDRNFVVYDGQRRLAAAKALGLPIYYIVASNISVWMVVLSGGMTRRWGFSDFLKHFCVLGLPDYLYLKSFKEKWPFIALPTVIRFLHGGSTENVDMIFKAGKFAATRRSSVEKFVDQLSLVKNRRLQVQGLFQRTLYPLTSNPDFHLALFVRRLNDYPFEFGPFGDAETCATRIQDVYNYRVSEDKKVRPQMGQADRQLQIGVQL